MYHSSSKASQIDLSVNNSEEKFLEPNKIFPLLLVINLTKSKA